MLKYSQKKINVSELKNLQSKRVFLRADFNVPFNKQYGYFRRYPYLWSITNHQTFN